MKHSLLAFTIAVVLFACSEKSLETYGANPPAPGSGGTTTPTTPVALGTLTFDLDGVGQNFSFYTRADKVADPNGGPGLAVGVLGVKDATASAQMTVYLFSDSTFKPGTYIDSASSTGMLAGMMFKNSTGTYGTNDDSAAPTTCVITSFSSASIAGTFKGSMDLSNPDGTFGKRLYVTNGKFNVKFP